MEVLKTWEYTLKKFLDNNINEKAVIMFDAASVTPYIQIKKDGSVDGLIGISQIPKKYAKNIIKNEGDFLNFIKVNYDLVLQAEFGITQSRKWI